MDPSSREQAPAKEDVDLNDLRTRISAAELTRAAVAKCPEAMPIEEALIALTRMGGARRSSAIADLIRKRSHA